MAVGQKENLGNHSFRVFIFSLPNGIFNVPSVKVPTADTDSLA